MVRLILGVVIGFIVWSILWIGSDQVFRMLSPAWYGAHQLAMEKALDNSEPFTSDTLMLVIGIVRSVIISLMSGFIAAFVANENKRSTFILGVLLLLFGLMVQMMVWNYQPVWYHAVFLLLLIPMTVFGGKLRSSV